MLFNGIICETESEFNSVKATIEEALSQFDFYTSNSYCNYGNVVTSEGYNIISDPTRIEFKDALSGIVSFVSLDSDIIVKIEIPDYGE